MLMTLQVHWSVSLSLCFSVVPIVLTKGGGERGTVHRRSRTTCLCIKCWRGACGCARVNSSLCLSLSLSLSQYRSVCVSESVWLCVARRALHVQRR
jgi:hypothetical protein